MKILVIGGSYFLGRVFTIVASKEHSLTLINRGRYSMQQFGVREYIFDRYDFYGIKSIPKENYDVVVDFCAYNSSDIETFVDSFSGRIKKYIFVSTCDIYERNIKGKKNEETPMESRRFGGKVGNYILGKILLEKELRRVCEAQNMEYGVIRPANIYGPYNYAQRESEYIRMVVQGETIPNPFDSNGEFQLVYVKDVANAILEVAKRSGNLVYNVCSEEINYERFFEVLLNCSKNSDQKYEPKFKYMTVNQIQKNNEFAPFPLTYEETELYDGSKIQKECDFVYTSLEDGMQKTFDAFRNVYVG